MTREEFLKAFPPLINSYKPTADFLERISKVSLLMIVGPSGVGKTTLTQRSGITYVPGDTTRDPRPEEKEGIDYHFRRDYERVIEDMKAGHFVQVAIGSGGDFYATKASSFPESGWAAMSIVADVIPIFRRLGFQKTVTAFITPPTYEEWIRRLDLHPATDEQRAKRIAEGRRSYKFALTDKQTHFMLNDRLDEAVKQARELLLNAPDERREARGRLAAQAISRRLNQRTPS